MPDPIDPHKSTMHNQEIATRQAREELKEYRKQRDPLREALDQIEKHYRGLPKRRA